MKNLSILGSTGSIGTNALSVVRQFPDRFRVKVLTARRNVEKLAKQVKEFQPEMVVVFDEDTAQSLEQLVNDFANPEIRYGASAYQTAAAYDSTDMVLTALVGAAGLLPTISAIQAGKDIALANKETLVMAGEQVMQMAQENDVAILPVDSEHSAIYQCLMGQRKKDVGKLLITASGGPFIETPADTFASINPEAALNHPNWQMGPKITIDSATMMNKGLEVIEAMHLFQTDMDRIQVVVHPQSIIHSMVAFHDGSIIAQLGIPDMKSAIAFALSFPERLPLGQPMPDFATMGSFTFKEPDLDKFLCLRMAMVAGKAGGTLPAVLNAANEIAVHAFLEGLITFDNIPKIIKKTLDNHNCQQQPSIEAILAVDDWARVTAKTLINQL